MASIDFMILETRLADSVDGFDSRNVLVCDDTVLLADILGKVRETITKRGVRVKRMLIYAHGIETTVYGPDDLYQCTERAGGYGVQLGKDGLTTSKTGEFTKLRGLFSGDGMLEFRSCAIAKVSPDAAVDLDGEPSMLSGNGRRLLLEVAAHADVKVKAADAVQYCTLRLNDKFLGFRMGNTTMEYADKWYGNVYIFDPATQSAKRI